MAFLLFHFAKPFEFFQCATLTLNSVFMKQSQKLILFLLETV